MLRNYPSYKPYLIEGGVEEKSCVVQVVNHNTVDSFVLNGEHSALLRVLFMGYLVEYLLRISFLRYMS